MHPYRPFRDQLSPLDALEPRYKPSLSSYGPRYSRSTPCLQDRDVTAQGLDRIPRENGNGNAIHLRKKYSEQDLRTRRVRASLSASSNHRSTASYPVYTPPTPSNPPATPTYYFWEGVYFKMERPRTSSGSSTTTITSGRPSWDSRQKSPLSIMTSMNFTSSRTSVDPSISAFSNERSMSAAKHPSAEVVVQVPRSGYRRYTGQGRQKPPLIDLIPSQTPGLGFASPTSPTSPMSPGFYTQKATAQSTGDSFRKLPEEILLVVLAELKIAHLGVRSTSCVTCYMRDLVALALSCRKWWYAVRSILYEDIQLIGNDSVQHTKKFKAKYGCRLKLLRRTLSSRPDLALYVKSLKVPSMPEAARSRREQEEYIDLVGTLVMACPNLERLPDFYPAYNHEFTHFVHAMSTRPKLTERVWIIDSSPSQRKRSEDPYVSEQSYLLPEQSIDFLTYHSNWSRLSTLFLHCNPDGIMDSALLIDVLDNLPSLQHLHVSSFPASGFNDTNLISLPPLQSLRLESLPGISSNGLSTYASLASSNTLTSLSLINTPLLSLPVLARLFSHLMSLVSFTLSQHASPVLPPNTDIFLYPYLASPTLKYLHWEITSASNTATSILSKSITSNGFPSLRAIRSPADTDGIIQSVCKPRERIELPTDRYRNEPLTPQTPTLTLPPRSTFSLPGIMSPTRTTFPELSPIKTPTRTTYPELSIKSPTHSHFSFEKQHSTPSHSKHSSISECNFRSTCLITARLQAQARLEAGQVQPKFHIIIWDPEGTLCARFEVGSYMGLVGSKIRYSLEPDVEGSEEAVISTDAVLGRVKIVKWGQGKEDECDGRWNLMDCRNGKGRDKERWRHSERVRWREEGLGRVFSRY